MSISDPPQAGQAGWHGFSLFLTFASTVFPLGLFSCWDFMGLDLYIDDRSIDAPATANELAFKNTSILFIEDGDFRWVSAFIRMSGCWLVARILVNRENSANQFILATSIFLYTLHSTFELGVARNLKSNQSLDTRS